MKKTKKYLIIIFLFLVFLIALFYIFLSLQNKTHKEEDSGSIINVSSSTNKVFDFSVMTPEERKIFGVSTTTDIRVIRRNASGTPTDYRIIK